MRDEAFFTVGGSVASLLIAQSALTAAVTRATVSDTRLATRIDNRQWPGMRRRPDA